VISDKKKLMERITVYFKSKYLASLSMRFQN